MSELTHEDVKNVSWVGDRQSAMKKEKQTRSRVFLDPNATGEGEPMVPDEVYKEEPAPEVGDSPAPKSKRGKVQEKASPSVAKFESKLEALEKEVESLKVRLDEVKKDTARKKVTFSFDDFTVTVSASRVVYGGGGLSIFLFIPADEGVTFNPVSKIMDMEIEGPDGFKGTVFAPGIFARMDEEHIIVLVVRDKEL